MEVLEASDCWEGWDGCVAGHEMESVNHTWNAIYINIYDMIIWMDFPFLR